MEGFVNDCAMDKRFLRRAFRIQKAFSQNVMQHF